MKLKPIISYFPRALVSAFHFERLHRMEEDKQVVGNRKDILAWKTNRATLHSGGSPISQETTEWSPPFPHL